MTILKKLAGTILLATVFAGCTTAATPQKSVSETLPTEKTTQVTTQVVESTTEVDNDNQVCKRIAKTGTRFKTKTCRSTSEWAAIAEQGKELARSYQGNK